MSLLAKHSLLLLAVALLAGCQSTAPPPDPMSQAAPPRVRPLLLLPPLPTGPAGEAQVAELGRQLYLALYGESSVPVLYAPEVAKLPPFLLADLLRTDGEPDLRELASLAEALDCSGVVFVELLTLRTVPPFRVALEARLFSREAGGFVRRCSVDLWLQDAAVAADYRAFLHHFSEGSGDAALHVAMLSNRQFHHYAASRTATYLLAPGAEAVHLPKDLAQPADRGYRGSLAGHSRLKQRGP